MSSNLVDITNRQFGNWLVKGIAGKNKWKQILWHCECVCGTSAILIGTSLKAGLSRKCLKCRNNKFSVDNIQHGHSRSNLGKGSREYSSWAGMRNRCNSISSDKYYLYGGRGIKVCERWSKFASFLEDMGHRPEGQTLDRIDVNGDYEPTNCKWSTCKEQASNRRVPSIMQLEIDKLKKIIKQYEDKFGLLDAS